MNICLVGVWSFLSICARLVYGVSYQYVLGGCMEFLIKIYAHLVYGVSNEYMLGWCMEFLINMCSAGVWSFL
jgi:hypothetical protein